MKRGLALFVTLLFLISLILIVNQIFSIYDKKSENQFENTIVQNSLIIKNVTKILSKLDINASTEKMIFNSFVLSNKKGDFRVLVDIKPVFDRVSINSKDNLYLDNVLNYYQIADPLKLEEILKNRKIYDYETLKRYLQIYEKEVGDKSVFKIPWKKLFNFTDENYLDCNILNKDVATFLGIEATELNCKNVLSSENKKIINKFSIMSFDKMKSYLVEINISYKFSELDLIYDIKNKRIKNIKSNILY